MNCLEALEKPRSETPAGLPLLLVAATALIDKDGRVLVAQRPEGKPMAGLWEFPGGKVKEGESPEFALCREIEEELGIEVRECCFTPIAFASHAYTDFHILMPLYVCRMWKGIITPREKQAVKWMKINELYNLKMPDADVPLIAQLMERL
ncbi:MAG: 8-oxo-dGTP diphosphatase MutT [Micavibrio aeruginosavorus]|uniref:8-oxo-dGTP diphosphatase n=1 Tax=Micavibrio aeruginosavorus TaxID=349221 RepID=A0A2W5MY28_9BACT|nr:MAG: 8-oxo-dGTP diphosphatase MutT [Micavibrio aeruginosavorus]